MDSLNVRVVVVAGGRAIGVQGVEAVSSSTLGDPRSRGCVALTGIMSGQRYVIIIWAVLTRVRRGGVPAYIYIFGSYCVVTVWVALIVDYIALLLSIPEL